MLDDCKLEQKAPMVIQCDNMSAVIVGSHDCTKHIEIRFHFIKNSIAEGVIVLEYCNTNSQVANILTKPLGSQQFHYLKMMLGVTDFQSREGVSILRLCETCSLGKQSKEVFPKGQAI